MRASTPAIVARAELDAAVLQAYGYSDLGPVPWGNQPAQQAWTDALLTRLVALNAQRALEEQQGTIRWLRPAFQDPVQRQQQAEMLLNVELLAHTNQGLEANFAYKTSENPAQADQNVIHATRSDISNKNAILSKTDSHSPPQPWRKSNPPSPVAVAGKKPCPSCLKRWLRWAGRNSLTLRSLPPGAMHEVRCSHRHTSTCQKDKALIQDGEASMDKSETVALGNRML